MKILFKNARILTMENDKIISACLITNENRIAYIGNDYESYGPFDRIIDCKNNLLMPGFKNAHAHSAMVFLRGLADDVTLHEWLFNIVFPREKKLKVGDVYHLNKVAYLEYFSSGITACYEHYFFPHDSAKAAEEMGMRTLLLGTYDKKKTPVSELINNYHLYNDRKESLVRYSIGFHAEYTSNADFINKTKEALDALKAPFYTHISETKNEVDECIKKHKSSPAKFLFEQGLFKYGGGGYHCIYLTNEEVKLFKDNNLTIVSCPGSNAKLASGIAPLKKYLDAGINIALGTDGPASNNSLDMFKEMYLASSLAKLTNEDPKAIPAFEILKMATVNGAKAMGLDDADVLAVNKYADLIMIDLSKPNMNPQNDIVTNLVYAGSKDNVKLTMINGKIVYENGKYFVNESLRKIYRKAEIVKNRLCRISKK